MKPTSKWFTLLLVVLGTLWLSGLSNAHTGEDVLRVAKLLYDSKTEFVTNLSELCDGIGGRVTGSKQAERAVGWAIHKLNTWGIPAVSESYIAPRVWMEDSASSKIVVTSIDNQYPQVEFSTFIASMGYSTTHGPLTAPLLYVQNCEDSEVIQKIAKGKLLFMETPLMGDGLESINDVFLHLQKCETLTRKVGAAGVIFMGDRPGGLLYRYPSAYSDDVSFPMVTVLREVGERLQRLLNGTYSRPRALQATIHSEMIFDKRNASCSNVVAEIKGTERPEEIVLLGAHIDSWDLGTGALDNGCNAVALMSVMHAFKLAGIQPKRTIRLALFTGEEQMFLGSWGYVLKHNSDLDNHVLALVIDLGSGAVTSFTVNGRAELIKPLNESLIPVANLGPFEIGTEPEFGTDNYDFLMQGVSNIVAEQEPAEYTKSYHSAIDTFDKVNVDSVLRNEVILSAVALHFASLDDVSFSARQSRQDIQKIMDTTSFGQAIRDAAPPLWDQWLDGTRGRKN